MTNLPVSVVVISANAAETIQRCLESLTIFDEVVVYLNQCTDNTADLCSDFKNVQIVEGEFTGFGPTRRAATEYAQHPWVLSIDTDEWLDDKLKHSIQHARFDSSCRAYAVRRHEILFGKSMSAFGARAKRTIRLYHRETGRYTLQPVHETVELEKGVRSILLPGKLLHEKESRDRSYFGVDASRYNLTYADRLSGKKVIHPGWALLRAWATFFKKYVLQGKCLAGWRGILAAHYAAHEVFVKHTAHYINTRVLGAGSKTCGNK